MTNTTEKPTEEFIPSEDQVTASSNGKAWHFAFGKIVRGERNPVNNSYAEERAKLVGRIRRIGVYNGVAKQTGKPFSQFELDIQTARGMEHVKCSLLGDDGSLRSSISCNGLAYALTQCEAGELIEIAPVLGAKPTTRPDGSKGAHPTYVNVGKVNAKQESVPIYRPRQPDNAPRHSTAEQWLALLPQLKAKSFYKERKAQAPVASASHIDSISADAKSKGWPQMHEYPAGWRRAMIAVGFTEAEADEALSCARDERAACEETEFKLGELARGLKTRSADMMPKALAGWMPSDAPKSAPKSAPKPAPAAVTAGMSLGALDDEYDPFEDGE